ncbi:hypothetical protein [Vulgatibacter incomptus]|uniref:tRNA nucleotidyltransferase n=1 Tax=Vulgatibacter incomptus TaxID=1391653 RepID=A0A0K1PFA4_9BACT|nr:hypothetical protein [Vulgatibacter incomptus]AKU92200.1 tRNA nucleotidyltransferase [Vulgatibacter incomptus]
MHDPYGGLADLKAGFLRVLHGLSFHDDPTRAFRAARFAARLDLRLAPETLGLMAAARRAGSFDALGRERLGGELDRILAEPAVVQAFRLLREWRLLPVIHKRFDATRGFLERLQDARSAAARAGGVLGDEAPSQAEVLWLAVASAIPRPDRATLDRMIPGGHKARRRFREGAEKAKRAVSALAKAKRPSDAAKLLERLDPAELVYALGLAEGRGHGRWIDWWLQEGRAIEPAFGGDELLAQGFRQGPAFGRALDAARRKAWDGADWEAQIAAARAVLVKVGRDQAG